MQCPGVPAGACPPGAAAGRRPFQIRAFSTALKSHVMVMDFVKSSWFPSQRRAKVCILRLYRGLPPAERGAGRCEEALPPQNTKMISSLVISQLMDEHKPAEKGVAVPVLVPVAGPGAQPPTWPGRRALATRSGVTASRALALLPGQPGPQPPAGVPAPAPALAPSEERRPGGSPQKGFASITVTARRVGPPARALVWGAGGDPLCTRCRAPGPPLRGPPALASGADPGRHHGPLACTEPSGSGPGTRLELPEAQARLCDGRQCWAAGGDRGEDRLSPDRRPAGQGPLLFSSCVHLRVARRCPSATCSPDRPLSVPVPVPVPVEPPPQLAGHQTHRSVLSLHLNCSSHRLTPEGAGGPACGGPISSSLRQRLAEDPALGQVQLGARTCPWSGPPPTGSTELAEAGTRQIAARKASGDPGAPGHTGPHASAHANQLSIHIPGWSYRAGTHPGGHVDLVTMSMEGDYTCCDLVVQIKECETPEAADSPGPAAPPPRPAPSEEPETPALRGGGSEGRPAPAGSPLTLQEALEARRPQFISRSQERLRRLEVLAQQRRAQRQESPLPARAGRRQCTVPHPLSDNLFKPKERCISEKEMHMRSKRIYNNLPEVRKKKEEQKKRVILQSNRLRAEVFKKQLLDQLLQRNAV